MATVAVLPADDSGCGWYRLRHPARCLADQGADLTVAATGPKVLWDRSWAGLPEPPPWVKVVGLAEPFPADVLVIQRPARRWWADIIPHLQASGTAVVVDVDDRLDRIQADHVARDAHDPNLVGWHNHRWLDRACQTADLVTCSTPALLARYGHGHGVVLPNLIPAAYLTHQPAVRRPAVGWSGTVETHPGDLDVTGRTVQPVLDRSGLGFHVVGTGVGVPAALGLTGEPTSTGWVDFADYPARVAELTVGIVPLADNPFNHAKSALKMLEMAALGVPVIGSPTPDNQRVHTLGVGLLAGTPNQWRRHLTRLCLSATARTDLAGRSREALTGHTYEARCDRWWAAWTAPTRRRLPAAG